MKVKELIDLLSLMNKDYDVLIRPKDEKNLHYPESVSMDHTQKLVWINE